MDDISAAVYNVVFTSIPILLFAVLDRPVKHLDTLLRFPQVLHIPSTLFMLILSPAACRPICFGGGCFCTEVIQKPPALPASEAYSRTLLRCVHTLPMPS